MISLFRIYLKLVDFPVKIGLNGGLGGGSKIIFGLESYYLYYLGAHTKIWNPIISLSGIYLKITHFPVKIGLIVGKWGVPQKYFRLKSYYLCYLGVNEKIWKLMISLSGIYLKKAHFPVKIGLIGGVGGVPEIFFFI